MKRSTLRAIVDLVPRYAHARRAGWTPPAELHGSITLPEYTLLRRVAMQFDDAPLPVAELHGKLANPYHIVDRTLDQLTRLVELGMLEQPGDSYTLAPAGRTLLMRGEPAANDYAAARIRLPPNDLARLASTLSDITDRQWQAPEPALKAHQDVLPRLRRFDRRQTPALQLEYAMYALQRARDDAHLAAWRAAGFRGPPFDLLSRVWAGAATTIDELYELMHATMRPEQVTTLLNELDHDGYIALEPPAVVLTARGRHVRDAIERETDRVYFAPWPHIDAEWVRERLAALADGFIRV